MRHEIFYTSQHTRPWSPPSLPPQKQGAFPIQLDPKQTYQTVLGFGGAFTESAAYVFSLLPPAAQQDFLEAYFDPVSGLGYTLGRVSVHSNDFSLCSYVYTRPGDSTLESFSLQHEELWLFPLLRRARQMSGGLSLLASPWSPPGWMKTNGRMDQGGALLPECRALWAEYLLRYLSAMEQAGLPVNYLTVQNEPEAIQPWESCLYTAGEEADFVADHLGPLLAQRQPQTKLLVWDHNRDVILRRAQGTLASRAAPYIWGMGYHWYVSEESQNLAAVHEAFPHTHLIFTEGCVEGGPRPGAWHTGERYARNYIADLNHWSEGFYDWNLLLDQNGGPNHVGNYCDAPILADTASGKLSKNSSYYYIGHLSRYIKPGAKRIGVAHASPLSVCAVQNPGGSLACVLLNETDTDLCAELRWKESVWIQLQAHSICTCVLQA